MVEQRPKLVVRPVRPDALGAIDDLVQPGVTGTDLPGEIDFRCKALTDDVSSKRFQGSDLGAALEVSPVRYRIDPTVEQHGIGEESPGRPGQEGTEPRTERIAHDEQVIVGESGVIHASAPNSSTERMTCSLA